MRSNVVNVKKYMLVKRAEPRTDRSQNTNRRSREVMKRMESQFMWRTRAIPPTGRKPVSRFQKQVTGCKKPSESRDSPAQWLGLWPDSEQRMDTSIETLLTTISTFHIHLSVMDRQHTHACNHHFLILFSHIFFQLFSWRRLSSRNVLLCYVYRSLKSMI